MMRLQGPTFVIALGGLDLDFAVKPFWANIPNYHLPPKQNGANGGAGKMKLNNPPRPRLHNETQRESSSR